MAALTPGAFARRLSLRLRWVNEDLAEVEWQDEHNNDWNYRVRCGPLLSLAGEMRRKLDMLLQAFMNEPDGDKPRQALRGLFELGHDLFGALFASVDGDDETARAARTLYERCDAQGDLALQLKVAPRLTLPWGLVVPTLDGADEASRDATAPNRLFWALRHDLSVATFGAHGDWRNALCGADVRVVAAVHRRIFESAQRSRITAFEVRLIEVLTERAYNGMLFDVAGLSGALRDTGRDAQAQLRVAYLLGHGNGQRFQLSDTDEISASSLVQRIQSTAERTQRLPTLLFLNGCQTAADAPDFRFADLLDYRSVCAFIGTEVRVPDLFAVRYSLALLHAVLVQGRNLREAVSALGRDHLPLSLAYSLYATDSLVIEPCADGLLDLLPPEARPCGNLSMGPVKCAA